MGINPARLSLQGASQATQNKLSRLVRRLTRFLIKMELIKAEIKLSAILNKLKLPFMKVTTLLLLLSLESKGLHQEPIEEGDTGP